ncbi:MAG: hypothetical protein ACFE9X_14955 [Promethearchaeota archaeon]
MEINLKIYNSVNNNLISNLNKIYITLKEGINIFCNIDGVNIPLVSTGTSPFIGAGQFGFKAFEWRRRFLYNPEAMLEILKVSYLNGACGIEVIPNGKIMEAAKMMSEMYGDYVITGSTNPEKDPGIKALIEIGAKLIFVHGVISDNKGKELVRLLDEISGYGIIPGIATHDPIPTIKYSIENNLNVRVFLIPFNANGFLMGNAKYLEEIVDSTKNFYFIGMKTLAAGEIKPSFAFEYIANHKICAVTIGMVTKQQAEESTKIALKSLNRKKNGNNFKKKF